MLEVTRPALRYFGGKFRLAPWIIAQFPPHVTYVEPFGGGANVLLRKEVSYNEVYNDLDGEVVNFFRILRERPDDLIKTIKMTPYSREEQRLAFNAAEDNLERARRLYVRTWQSHGGGRTQWRTGWRYEKGMTRGKRIIDDWNETEHLWWIVERLKNVQIENDLALRVMMRFDTSETLFYLDPPYVRSTRSKRWREKAYTEKMNDEDHLELARVALNLKGMVIISGHPSNMYDELFTGWEKLTKTTPTDFQARSVECLWISPNAKRNQPQRNLFSL